VSDLDPVIHAPKRLRIMSILNATDSVEFARLQEVLDLAAPDLSKQTRALADAGYVRIRKTGRGPGSATWFELTRQGRAAFRSYVTALRALIDQPAAKR
jgi:DNA-binding MarR family transcriptional regulator